MKYNQEIYLEKKKDLLIEEYIGEPLNIDEVKETFRKFNYNFDLLSEKVSSSILRYGELKNITEVLDCLKGFKYPKLDEETQGNIIFALVVGSSFETINNVTINASNRGLTPEDLIEIPTVLIRQSNEETLYRKKKQSDEHPVSIPLNEIRKDVNILVGNEIAFELLNGRSSDFLSNIEYLEDNGYVDDNNCITPDYHNAVPSGTLAPLPQQLASISEGVFTLINGIFDPSALKDMIQEVKTSIPKNKNK